MTQQTKYKNINDDYEITMVDYRSILKAMTRDYEIVTTKSENYIRYTTLIDTLKSINKDFNIKKIKTIRDLKEKAHEIIINEINEIENT